MTGREYDEDDIGLLYCVAEYASDGVDRLEALGDDATLGDVLRELDTLRAIFAGAYNHTTKMRNEVVGPYAAWDREWHQWQVDETRERVATLQAAQDRADRAKRAQQALRDRRARMNGDEP